MLLDNPSPLPAVLSSWDQVFPWLDAHAGAVGAIATIVLVLVTIVYVLLTRRMATAARDQVNETQRDREIAYRPYIAWRIDSWDPHTGHGTVTVANNSRAAAYHCILVSAGHSAAGTFSWHRTVPFDQGPDGEGHVPLPIQFAPPPSTDVLGTSADPVRVAFCENQFGHKFRFRQGTTEAATWVPPLERRGGRRTAKPSWVVWYESILASHKW